MISKRHLIHKKLACFSFEKAWQNRPLVRKGPKFKGKGRVLQESGTHKTCARCWRFRERKFFLDKEGVEIALCGNCQKASSNQRMARFGVTAEHVEEMLVAQDWKCDICRAPIDEMKNQAVDHDHRTHRVRGMLCRKCNIGLGHFRDDPDFLESAAKYIRKYQDPKLLESRPAHRPIRRKRRTLQELRDDSLYRNINNSTVTLV